MESKRIVRHLYCAVPGFGYSTLAARYSPVTSIFDLTKHISLLDVHGSFLSKEVGLGDCEQAHCGAWDWSGKVILPLLLSYIEVTSNFSLDAPPCMQGYRRIPPHLCLVELHYPLAFKPAGCSSQKGLFALSRSNGGLKEE